MSSASQAVRASIPPEALRRMVAHPAEPEEYVALGHHFYRAGHLAEAAAAFASAAALDPKHAEAYHLLGWVRQALGDAAGAMAAYGRAMQIDPEHQNARRNLAMLLAKQGRRTDSLMVWREDLRRCPDTSKLLKKLLSDAMMGPDLTLAGQYSAINAELYWGGHYAPRQAGDRTVREPVRQPEVTVTVEKLLHDAEQFEYLQQRGVMGSEFDPVIAQYRQIAAVLLAERGPEARVPLEGELRRRIGSTYCRILHVRETPRVAEPFSGSWDPVRVEEHFINSETGVVVIDDFLSRDALQNLQAFCLESTLWSGNRYAHGRIGAFIQEGFSCPLLLQVAEELRGRLGRVIGQKYPLRGAWGFKTPQRLPADATNHADFAAVNVNFWITRDEANLQPEAGGLVIYDVDAPLAWDFHSYNGRTDMIVPFLRSKSSTKVNIPYRSNRAIIFNSDLFHATAEVNFRPGYENRRINITMLYGERQNDMHHPNVSAAKGQPEEPGQAMAWRSGAFSRRRH